MADTYEVWNTAWSDAVSRTEQQTGVPAAQWRKAGRATKANPNGEDLEFWYSEGLRQVEEYAKWTQRTTWEIHTMPDGKPAVEWAATVEFGGMPVQLVIDAIYVMNAAPWVEVADTDLCVVDYKTGSRTPAGTIQLGLYASAIEKVYGWRPKWGAYYMTRKAKVEDVIDLSPWGVDYFDYHFGAMKAQMDTGYFPANVGDHCSYCGYRDYCFAANGSKASEYPMITGMEISK